jgi:hypothetical protein
MPKRRLIADFKVSDGGEATASGRVVKSEAVASPPSRDLSWVGIVLAILADQSARFPRTQQERPPIPGSLHARHSS